jgi:AbrB family looped-hinge helix DNA binding protein
MKVTIKGQVTIPVSFREQFGLEPGTEVEFVAENGVLQVRPRKRTGRGATRFDQWLAKAAGSAKPGLSTDELLAETRGEG